MQLSEWKATLLQNSIAVERRETKVGDYSLLPSPYCEICSSPGLTTEQCSSNPLGHSDLYGFKKLYAVGSYFARRTLRQQADALTRDILSLKSNKEYAIPLGLAMDLCAQNLYPELKQSDLIVPVPQHPQKIVQRGYNQALELAQVLGRCLKLPVQDLLEKTRNISMKHRPRNDIKTLVQGLYRSAREKGPQSLGRQVLFLDDTATTCFDAAECARQLKEAGAKDVNVFVVGRTAWSY